MLHQRMNTVTLFISNKLHSVVSTMETSLYRPLSADHCHVGPHFVCLLTLGDDEPNASCLVYITIPPVGPHWAEGGGGGGAGAPNIKYPDVRDPLPPNIKYPDVRDLKTDAF